MTTATALAALDTAATETPSLTALTMATVDLLSRDLAGYLHPGFPTDLALDRSDAAARWRVTSAIATLADVAEQAPPPPDPVEAPMPSAPIPAPAITVAVIAIIAALRGALATAPRGGVAIAAMDALDAIRGIPRIPTVGGR